MTKILCADTSSQLCSVSIFSNDDLVDNVNSKIERSHSKLGLGLSGYEYGIQYFISQND